MNRLPWILLVAVVALVVLVFRHVSGNIGRGAEELLASARASVEAGDTGLVLGTLDTALELARDEGDDALVEAILLERADLLTQRRAYPAARADYEALLAMDPEDPDFVALRLVTLDVLSGNWRDGIAAGLALVEERPRYAPGRLQLARAYGTGAVESFEEIEGYLTDVLPAGAAREAVEAARRTTNLPPGTAQQVEAFHDLLGVFERAGVLFASDFGVRLAEIAELRQEERRHFATGSQGKLNALAADALLESFLAAGHDDEAAFLARYALGSRQGNRRNQDFIRSCLEAILETGRGAEAADLAEDWYGESADGGVGLPTLLSVGQALFAGERWVALGEVGARLIEAAPSGAGARYFRDSGRLFAGLSAARGGDDRAAEEHLSALRAPDADPRVEGGVRLAFAELARIANADGRLVEERTLLERLCNTFPTEAGDAWSRLAELHELTSDDPDEGLRALTDGLRASPSFADDWRDAWYELARASFERRGRDLATLASDVRNGRVTLDDLFIGDTDGVLVVRELVDEGWASAARFNALLLAEKLRDFPLLVELQFEACIATERFEEARNHAVRLLAWGVGGGAAGSFLRRSWENGTTEPERIYDILREGSPELSALFFAAGLLEQGRFEGVVEELEFFERTQPDADMQLLEPVRARALLGLGRPRLALEALVRLPARSRAWRDALELHAEAVAAAPDERAFALLLERLDDADWVTASERLAVARRLLDGGHGAWVLETLDGASSESIAENAQLFDLRALGALLEGELDRAEEFIARGRAFSQDGASQLLEVLFAVSRGDAELVGALADRVDPRSSSRSVRCALAILRADPILSRATLPRELPDAPLRPLWSVLWRIADPALEAPPELALDDRVAREFERAFGGPIEDRSAQGRFAAAVVAVSDARLVPWLAQSLGRMDAREGLWQGYFAWLATRDTGDADAAVVAACELVGAFPFLTDAWAELARLAALEPTSARAVAVAQAFAARPVSSFAGRDRPPLLFGAGSALVAHASGDEQLALEFARAIAAEERRHPLASLIAARVLEAAGYTDEALDAYAAAIDATATADASRILAEYLGVVVEAAREQRIEPRTQTERVAALTERFADDETLEAHRALAAVGAWSGAAFGARLLEHATALDALANDFEAQLAERLASTGRPVGPAAAAVWSETWRALDPERGVEVFERQLASGPTRLDLWLYHLDLLVASDAVAEAERLGARLSGTVVDAAVQRWRARFVSRVLTTADAPGPVRLARVLERVPPDSVEALEARLRLAAFEGDAESIRRLGDELWTRSASDDDAAVVSGIVARQRLLLGEREDESAARTILRGGLAARADLVRREVLALLGDLAGLER